MRNRYLVITIGMIVIAFSSFGQQPKTEAKSPTPNVKIPVKKMPPAGSKAYNQNNGAQTVKDIDGNIYHTVTIGTQTWMVENLKTTRYNDGTAIPKVTDSLAWAKLITPACCWYNNGVGINKTVSGLLYNFHAVRSGKLCPTGWHVPSNQELRTLITFLGGESAAGGKLKETGTAHWAKPTSEADNSSGFTALPDGARLNTGEFIEVGYTGAWWSKTEFEGETEGSLYNAYMLLMASIEGIISSHFDGNFGLSVRCIKDEVPNSSSKVTGDATKDGPPKLPLTITRTGPRETLTLTFEYDTSYKLKQIKASNKKGEKETISFRYLKSKILSTHVTSEQTETDTLFIQSGLIVRDNNYKYVYKNNRLVETRSLISWGDRYTIRFDSDGNAYEMIRIMPPWMKDAEEVIQTTSYTYDLTLKNRFFFSTDWGIGSFFSLSENDSYGLPTSSLYGLGSANLVTEVENNFQTDKYQFKYLSFDESGYPTHYEIHAISTYDNKSRLLADYKITYTGGSLPKQAQEVIPPDSKINEQAKTIKIGTQTWFVENLNVSFFRNGDPIPEAKTVEAWQNAGNLEKPAWCYYENDPENGKIYGKLYNWYAVTDPRGLAPKGMHVPSDAELKLLTSYLGGKEIAGGKLKESRTLHWKIPNISATNETGFSGLPGGSRSNSAGLGTFSHLNTHGLWWSSSSMNDKYAMSIVLFGAEPKLDLNSNFKEYGFSVRCIED